ncbi:hypothetical protein FQR65_LT07101 [Abscondita terminalis]|nr:hypothetical protein FQR65_LT07101 [Abscondita terminalis]
MRLILPVLLLAFITINKIKAEDNEITEQPEKSDKNLRKALLKALNDLETENESNKVVSGVQEAQASTFSIVAPDETTTPRAVTYNEISTSRITSPPTPKPTVSPRVTEKTPATPPTTTTTTEESEAKVEDLQFFAAPLVAAFTVHQDELGIPKGVEPILKEAGEKTVTTKDLEEQRLKVLQEIQKKQDEEKRKVDEQKFQEYLRKQEQIRIQHELEEKQRLLEQQFRTLQERQKQQDYYFRQQQLIQEQQRLLLLEEQKRSSYSNNFNSAVSVQPALTFQPQPEHFKSAISIQPALNFQPEQYVDNSLQLPTKNYQNFQKPQFPTYSQQLPVQNAANFQSTFSNSISPNAVQNYRPHGNRVFRHESGTGNFVNSDYNKFSNSNRFFKSNPHTYSITPSIHQDYHSSRYVRAPYVNNQLNNLLYYSGISQGKQPEDLSLISKVLAFNIHGDSYYSGSENVGQRLLPTRNYYLQS